MAYTYVVILDTSETTWTVPTGWNNSDNFVECFGPGGLSQAAAGGYGGGGGAYAKKSNLSLTPGASVSIQIGDAGSGVDTWFSSSGTLLAKSASGQTGGAAASCVGDTKYSGGNGGNGNGTAGGGGGGAGGNLGNGVAGNNAVSSTQGGAGGASGEGANGGSGTVTGIGNDGDSGAEVSGVFPAGLSVGGGGGGGGAAGAHQGGVGGWFGGGGGGSGSIGTARAGIQGGIIIAYTSLSTSTGMLAMF